MAIAVGPSGAQQTLGRCRRCPAEEQPHGPYVQPHLAVGLTVLACQSTVAAHSQGNKAGGITALEQTIAVMDTRQREWE